MEGFRVKGFCNIIGVKLASCQLIATKNTFMANHTPISLGSQVSQGIAHFFLILKGISCFQRSTYAPKHYLIQPSNF